MDEITESLNTPEEILEYLEEDRSEPNLNQRRADLFKRAAYLAALQDDMDRARGHWAEFLLYSLHAAEPDNGDGDYLQPMITVGAWGWPDPNSIPDNMLDYLEERFKRTGNSYLKARYGDFLWQRGRGHLYARHAALAHLEIVRQEAEQGRYHHAADSARRSLSLAFALNDKGLSARAIENVTAEAERWAGEPEDASFFVTPIIEKILTHSRLRDRTLLPRWENLLRAGLKATREHYTRRELLSKLGMVLARSGSPKDARQCKIEIGEEWEIEAEEREADSLVAAVFYNHALEVYSEAGAKEKVRELKIKTRAKFKSAEKELKPLSWQFKIDVGPWTDQVSEWLNEGCYEALIRLAGYLALIPRWRAAEEQTARLSQEAPLSQLIPTTILDDGRPISRGQTEEERHLQNVRRQYNMMIIGTAAQLSSAIGLIRERQLLTADCLVEAIKDSPFFDTDKIELITRGFERYVEGDYISTVHVLVPQAENVLRRFLGKVGGNTLSYREGRLREKPLEQVLSADEMKATLKLLSGDVWEYFNHVLIAETGMNLRNKIAHGLITVEDIDENTANIVVHLYLLLGLFRSKNDGSE